MAFVKTPTTWLPGYTADSTAITIPLAALASLEAAEANTTTGDIRAILFGILQTIANVNTALDSADRSTRFSVSSSANQGNATISGVNTPVLNHSFNVTFQTQVISENVPVETL
jgi:hypothetical protein